MSGDRQPRNQTAMDDEEAAMMEAIRLSMQQM
jgi:hypothetical protein